MELESHRRSALGHILGITALRYRRTKCDILALAQHRHKLLVRSFAKLHGHKGMKQVITRDSPHLLAVDVGKKITVENFPAFFCSTEGGDFTHPREG